MDESMLSDMEILIDRRDWQSLRRVLTAQPPPEVADLLLQLERPKKALIFRAMPRQFSASVFSYLEPKDKDSLLQELTNEETRQLLEDMRPDDRTELLEEMPGQATQRLLNVLSPSDMREASWLLGLFRGGFEIGAVVGLTMALIVLLTDLIGAALPYLLTRMGLDPAVASSPLIASLADAMGLLIYFTVARMILDI